ncbi:class I SAM-dependent methyltransferase [Pseudorhodoplanes sp.]|uniref:class I SAM-dependent methyltransferase n=1 Tax=Pseudorhodoplanes sp. TaxID=1934341 RepID=UPI003919F7C9
MPSSPPEVSLADAARWYDGKSFRDDWTSWHFPNWLRLLAPFRGRPAAMLEIGSWEGRSALFFLNYLPQMRLTCIDTFAGGQEHRDAAAADAREAELLQALESRFDTNVAAFSGRIDKVKAPSAEALIGLGLDDRRFDLAYIDGGHRAREVYADCALTWPLMVRGGLVIIDDYQWAEMPDPMDNPKPGVDAFLRSVEGQYRMVLDDYQLAIEKR